VYFPNRAHRARIGVKQLRYAAEIGQATGVSDLRRAIKSLRKGQEILGDLHDRQSLSDTLSTYVDRDHVDPDHIALTSQVLEGEILDLHARYLARRADLREICEEIQKISFGSRTRPALAVGAALLVSASAILKSRSARPQERLVEVRGRLAG
jgi:CHAD domain